MRGGRCVHSLEADLSASLKEEEENTPAIGDTSTDDESDVGSDASLEEEAEIAPAVGETSDEDEPEVTSDTVAGIAAGLASDDNIENPLSSSLSWL